MTRPWLFIGMALASCSSSDRKPVPLPSPDAAIPSDDMILVPAGWFTAGCATSPQGHRPEGCFMANPPRRVWVSSFEIDRLETTRAAYRSCVAAAACADGMANFPGALEDEHRGAVRVNLSNAEAYCRWRGERLPTLSEWEKAARGAQDARAYPWGDAAPDCTRSWRTGEMRGNAPCPYNGPVGKHPAGRSPYGVEDMYGSVHEWTSTYFSVAVRDPQVHVDYAEVVREGTTLVLASWTQRRQLLDPNVVDPQGPPSQGEGHVLKGDTGTRGHIGENNTGLGDDVTTAGFRCVRSVPGPAAPVVEMPPPGTAIAPYREPGFEP